MKNNLNIFNPFKKITKTIFLSSSDPYTCISLSGFPEAFKKRFELNNTFITNCFPLPLEQKQNILWLDYFTGHTLKPLPPRFLSSLVKELLNLRRREMFPEFFEALCPASNMPSRLTPSMEGCTLN